MAFTVPRIDNKGILTATSGFLGDGFTHTINSYSGCAFAGTMCGTFCYAQHNHWITAGRPWKLYGVKNDIVEAYRREFDRLKRPQRGVPKPLRIFMSSSTDPYLPQEKMLGVTQALLKEMVTRVPDALVVQTHSTLVLRDLDLLVQLARLTKIWVSITVETDLDKIEGFPPHAYLPGVRIAALRRFRDAGVRTRVTVSPLLPIRDLDQFAADLGAASEEVILDHYLLGDGSPGGMRTRKTSFPEMLRAAGYDEWNSLEKFWAVVRRFREILGVDRILTSRDGFNSLDR